jgi:hypothetical protein
MLAKKITVEELNKRIALARAKGASEEMIQRVVEQGKAQGLLEPQDSGLERIVKGAIKPNISFSIKKRIKNPPVANGIRKLMTNRRAVLFQKVSLFIFALWLILHLLLHF